MLSEILKVISGFQDLTNRIEVNIFIGSQFNLAQEFDKALDFIEKGLQDIALAENQDGFPIFTKVDLRCKAARQLAKLGQSSRSIDILHIALQQAIELDNPDDSDYSLINIAEVYAEMKLYDQAIQIGLLIADDFRRIHRLFRSIAFTAIIEHSDHGQIQNILLAIDESIDRENLLVEIAGFYSAHNLSERAIDLVSLISDPYTKARALVEGVKGMDKEISRDLILSLLTQAQTYAYLEENISFRASILSIIASQYIDLKQFTTAQILLEQSKNLAMTMSAEDVFAQVPRDFILQGIAVDFAKIKEFENTVETIDTMTDEVMSGSTLTNIAQDNLDSTFEFNVIQELTEAENALTGDDSHLADLNRVRIAKSWAKLNMFDKVQLISNQISDPNLKELALGYGGLDIGESDYDRGLRLSRACHIAGEQNNLEVGISILRNVLEEILSFDEGLTTYYLKEIIKNYFCLIMHKSESLLTGNTKNESFYL